MHHLSKFKCWGKYFSLECKGALDITFSPYENAIFQPHLLKALHAYSQGVLEERVLWGGGGGAPRGRGGGAGL